VANDESYTNKETGERKEAVEWHRVIVREPRRPTVRIEEYLLLGIIHFVRR
jgi:hypothetical protein